MTPDMGLYMNREEDYKEAVLWARHLLSTKEEWLILNCETTGIKNCVVIELAVISADGNVLMNNLIKLAKGKRISAKAHNKHRIDKQILNNAPRYGDIYQEVREIIKGKTIVSYYADFYRQALNRTAYVDDPYDPQYLNILRKRWHCAMKQYAKFVGKYSPAHDDYEYQHLPDARHTALADCWTILRLIQKMAAAPDWAPLSSQVVYDHKIEDPKMKWWQHILRFLGIQL